MSPALSTPSLPITIAPLDRALERDVNFVRSSWTQSYVPFRPSRTAVDADGKVHVWRQDARAFWVDHSAWLDALLDSMGTTVLVARANDAEGLLVGWTCWSATLGRPARLHYVYVKKSFRGMGVAGMLLANVPTDAGVVFTHWTTRVPALRLPASWEWSPFATWSL